MFGGEDDEGGEGGEPIAVLDTDSERGTRLMAGLSIGDEAPNFDLTSTEDAVLMLRDEVPRTAVLLYFFADLASDQVRSDLAALAAVATQGEAFGRAELKVMGVSPAKLDDLKQAQSELGLPFPLLTDDRGFSGAYGMATPIAAVPPAEDGENGEEAPAVVPDPSLVLVNRDQRVLWLRNPAGSIDGAICEILARLKSLPKPTVNYPRSVINRLVNFWVN